jgi:hypothetical protein
MSWRTTQELAGACLLEALGDGFTCFLHEKLGKDAEDTVLRCPCKAQSRTNEVQTLNFFVWKHTTDFPFIFEVLYSL